MDTQPPPDAPAPPPSKHADRSRKWLRGIVWMGFISVIILMLIFFTAPLLFKSEKAGNFVRTLGNSKQIGLALMVFEKDYGRYPDATTIAEVRARTSTTMILGTTTSNDYLRQLLAAGIGNEKIFEVRGKGTRRPDDDYLGSRALEKGECGFAYIPGLSSSSPTDMPIIIGPLIPGTDRADTKRADGKVIACCVDGSAIEMMTDKAGHVLIHGKRLLDPSNPIWDGKPPTLVWPE